MCVCVCVRDAGVGEFERFEEKSQTVFRCTVCRGKNTIK